MKCLITGITGFAGSHLAEYLLSLGKPAPSDPERDSSTSVGMTEAEVSEVHGTIRWRSRTENIEHLRGKIHLHDCDLRDPTGVSRLIAKLMPDRIYHLAAQSYVPMSWIAPAETLTTNIISQTNILEAVRAVGGDCRIQIAGSSEEYGMVFPNEVPIKETNPLRPLSPYAVSKVAQDLMGYQYHQSYKMPIIRTRGFNHEGPRRGEVFVTSNFAKQIAEIEKGKREAVLYVGNLEAVRDFTDVRDTVRAYYLILEKGIPGEVYNVATGKGYKIQEVIEILKSLAKTKFEVRQDPNRLRPSDVELLIGDPSKLKQATGWEPKIPFEQTLEDLLNYWRERV